MIYKSPITGNTTSVEHINLFEYLQLTRALCSDDIQSSYIVVKDFLDKKSNFSNFNFYDKLLFVVWYRMTFIDGFLSLTSPSGELMNLPCSDIYDNLKNQDITTTLIINKNVYHLAKEPQGKGYLLFDNVDIINLDQSDTLATSLTESFQIALTDDKRISNKFEVNIMYKEIICWLLRNNPITLIGAIMQLQHNVKLDSGTISSLSVIEANIANNMFNEANKDEEE